MITGPHEELLELGTIGEKGAALLYKSVAAVARFDRYPPPDGHSSWTSDAVKEVAHDFLVGERSTERMNQLGALAYDERSFARLLEAAVRNFFRSTARATERGRLRRRLLAALESDPIFAVVGPGQEGSGRWVLSGGSTGVWAGRIETLLAAASSVPIALVRLQEGPSADRASIRELCRQVLAAAEGSVVIDDLLWVLAMRLGLRRSPLVGAIDWPDSPVAPDAESESLDAIDAHVAFAQLTARERLLFLVLDQPVREAGEFVGVSKSAAAAGLDRLRAKLQVVLQESRDRPEVLRLLASMCEQWAFGRTDPMGSASKGE